MKKRGKSLKTWKNMNNKKWHRWNIKSVEEDIDDNVELLMISSMMNWIDYAHHCMISLYNVIEWWKEEKESRTGEGNKLKISSVERNENEKDDN